MKMHWRIGGKTPSILNLRTTRKLTL